MERWRPSADECAALGLDAASIAGVDRSADADTDARAATSDVARERRREDADARAGSAGAARVRVWPQIVTRAGLYRSLHERLDEPPWLLDDYAREVLFQRAAADAIARGDAPPFEVRPGLVPEMLSIYDALRRQHRLIDDFERLVGGALEAGAEIDRGARRLLQQTRFLVSAFRAYESRLVEGDALDEHGLRARLLERPSARPLRRAIVTVPDQRADAAGLWPADFDLLTRLAGLEAIDLVATEALLATGYLERVFETLPDIDVRVMPDVEAPAPLLLAPAPDSRQDPLHFTSRDREQELADVAQRLMHAAALGSGGDARGGVDLRDVTAPRRDDPAAYERMAVVYQRPLPYLYLARQVFGAHDVPWQAFDALPLAAEPYAAALDLVITFALSGYTRAAGIALLRAPHFRFEVDGHEPTLTEIAACDAELRDAGFLGGRDRLRALRDEWRRDAGVTMGDEPVADHANGQRGPSRGARPGWGARGGVASRARGLRALEALVAAADALEPLEQSALPSLHLETLQQFLATYERQPVAGSVRMATASADSGASSIASFRRAASAPVTPSSTSSASASPFTSPIPSLAAGDAAADGAAAARVPPSASMSSAEESLMPLAARHVRARAAIIGTIGGLRLAFAERGEREGPFRDVAALLHRWLEGQTFNPRVGESGLHLIDVQAAMYGRFSHVALVGVVEGEWPAASSRSIFYPSSLLRDLGWPTEPERRAAARAVFDDLLRLAREEVSVSVFALEHDAIVRPSPFVEDLASAGLHTRRMVGIAPAAANAVRVNVARAAADAPGRLLTVPALTIDPGEIDAWAALRAARSPAAARDFHGWTGAMAPRAYSVTGLDRYLQCPFRYFAGAVLRLEEEPERRPGLTPLERGRFEHEVFQRFFERWDDAGRGAIDEASLDAARGEFVAVVDEVLARLPPSERELERTRLLGSAVSAGLGERVFRFEAARLAPITERLLEYSLDGEYLLSAPAAGSAATSASDDARAMGDVKVDSKADVTGESAGGHVTAGESASTSAPQPAAPRTRRVRLRGIADRIDLLADGTMRVIDYKTGKASSAASSIQLPVYAHCAEQRLDAHRGRHWRVSEAGYLAFGRPEPFVPVVTAGDDAPRKVTQAIARVIEVVDRIEEGAFPVAPVEPHNCIFCGFAAVCRKDYVDDD